MKLALAALLLVSTQLQPVYAATEAGWYLKVEVPRSNSPPPKPTVTVADRSSVPTFDPSSGKWLVPLDTTGSNFVIPYVVSGFGNEVVAVQIDIPTRIVKEHQSIYLGPPSLSEDEKSIREFWSTNRITSEPSDTRLQFRYLQDLLLLGTCLFHHLHHRHLYRVSGSRYILGNRQQWGIYHYHH